MGKFDYLNIANAAYIDEMLSRYEADPHSVDETWRFFFEGIELGSVTSNGHSVSNGVGATSTELASEFKVIQLINAYREKGHYLAHLDPLSDSPPQSHPELTLAAFGLSDADLGTIYQAGIFVSGKPATLSEILARLKLAYCGTTGVELNVVENPVEREWIRQKIESGTPALDRETKRHILKRLTESESWEKFIHTRYVAQKRFSGEGGESVLPGLDAIIEKGTELGADEFIMGMAHRGRLSTLVNLCKKPAELILTEFEQKYTPDPAMGDGDVKYHMGFESDLKTRQGKEFRLCLAFNPSHLEFVDPVVMGLARAKQVRKNDESGARVIPILIHGDAAFAGQGVVYETIMMTRLKGYKTGGTIHIILNNQVGFTTSPVDARSTRYCSDLAKTFGVPILHVNGDDPEAVWRACQLATEYRNRFQKDFFIDLVCYRKFGHNEGDEPAFTQPLMAAKIKAKPTPKEVYLRKASAEGVANESEVQAWTDEIMNGLTQAQTRVRETNPPPFVSSHEGRVWSRLKIAQTEDLWVPVKTAVNAEVLRNLGRKINTLPSTFTPNSKLTRFFEARLKALEEGKGIDWGLGEALAYATLLNEGIQVRLSGQDAERGTFTHRHAVLKDTNTGESYTPHAHLSEKQGRFFVHNSFLSETGVLGFDYGWSIADPFTLVIWEAQFGDFANGAQVIIDQFIAASESKWRRTSGLVLLLPHGYEGQGPEHSSARLERFLQLCGKENLQVANLTTPANLFHALRRQIHRDFRKPLVIMSPKSLLRHPSAVSDLTDFTDRGFQEVIDDAELSNAQATGVRRVLFCSGKVYYDLLAARQKAGIQEIAIVRVEQLFPWPAAMIQNILSRYKNAEEIFWVQEEPKNMGGWTHVFNVWMGGFDTGFHDPISNRPIRYIGRDRASSPAVGSHRLHEEQQHELVEKALHLAASRS